MLNEPQEFVHIDTYSLFQSLDLPNAISVISNFKITLVYFPQYAACQNIITSWKTEQKSMQRIHGWAKEETKWSKSRKSDK